MVKALPFFCSYMLVPHTNLITGMNLSHICVSNVHLIAAHCEFFGQD